MGNTIDIITLGCSKNFVDSQRLGTMFRARGYDVRLNPEQVGEGNRVVVNTCGFIGDAKEESINTILELCDARTAGRIRELSVMGCLSQRYLKELQHEIPEVDRWYGKFDWAAL
ncbi:MAG: 30S ribosomal protein S12 methylthiotransferase RimO, partial [Alloprevotella sp.]|nr:30S ribosomal protein S12 methylthiotransferase RimO [Alloprevotella sp.]